mmetsp:Transcript_32101/g.65280  ORF Transcript_32101/g.65280 Transcript_32101/m.65280 type:complete len:379 (-) Transcript_32101:1055-2191(-)
MIHVFTMTSVELMPKRENLRRDKFLLGLVLFCVACAITIIIPDLPIEVLDSPEQNNFRSLRSEGDDVDSKRAIALISFGEAAAKSTLAERAVLSIRRRGEFDGKVVLITDAPEERYDGVFDENVIVMQSKDEDMKIGYFYDEAMKYKRYKTLIPQYFDSEPDLDEIEHIYYMDIDMMMGAPFQSLVNGLDEKYGTESIPSDGNDKIFMFSDPLSATYVVNSGFIALDREKSRRCLESWRKEMDANPGFPKDQLSLNEVFEKSGEDENYGCEIVPMEHENYLRYTVNESFMLNMMDEEVYPNLIHIYNSCKAEKFSETSTELFVSDVLMLSEEEKAKHGYGKAVITPSKTDWESTQRRLPELAVEEEDDGHEDLTYFGA